MGVNLKQVNSKFYGKVLHLFYYKDLALGKKYIIGIRENIIYTEYYDTCEVFELNKNEENGFIMENI